MSSFQDIAQLVIRNPVLETFFRVLYLKSSPVSRIVPSLLKGIPASVTFSRAIYLKSSPVSRIVPSLLKGIPALGTFSRLKGTPVQPEKLAHIFYYIS